MSRRTILVLLVLVLITVGVWFATAKPPLDVETARVERGTVLESLDEDGLVRSDVEADLAVPVAGRLERFLVRTGDRVRQGQIVAYVERDSQEASVQRARAERKAAESAVEQARQRAAAEGVAADAAVLEAEAAAEAAEARLQTVEEGTRSQDLESARAALQQAEAAEREAASAAKRARTLLKKGYIPPSEAEAADTRLASARSALQQARSRLSLAREGARPSEREAARADRDRAMAARGTAEARRMQALTAAQEVEAAQARLEAAKAAVEQAQAGMIQAEVRAPRDGVITVEDVEPGETVTPQTRLARIVDPAKVWVEILVDENDRGKVKEGQEVQLLSDAWPDRPAKGRLARIDAYAQLKRTLRGTPTQDEDRVFRARVDILPGGPPLQPGMSVFAEVVLRKLDDVLFISREAVVTREGDWFAFVNAGNRAEQRKLEVGVRDINRVQVLEGLVEGEEVVLNPGNLQDGARLK